MATEKDFKVKNGLQVGNGLINATSGDVSLRRGMSSTNRIRITSGNIINDTNVIISGNLDVSGNFNITGDINQTSVTTLDVTDKTITVANNAGSASAANGAGLIVDTGTNNPSLIYTSATDEWDLNRSIHVSGAAGSGVKIDSGGAIVGGGATGGDTQLMYWGGGPVYYGRSSLGGTVSGHEFRVGGVTKLNVDSSGDTVVSGNLKLGANDLLYTGGGNFDIKHTISSQNITLHTTTSGGATSEIVRVTHNKRVGINIQSPDAPLHVEDSPAGTSAYGGLRVVGAGTGSGSSNVRQIADFGRTSSGSDSGAWIGGRTDETTAIFGAKTASGNIAFEVYQAGWKERMRIKNDGKVGIGTTNPLAQLHIENTTSDGIIVRTTSNVEPFIALQRNSGSNGVAVLRGIDGGDLRIDTGATGAAQTTKMTVTSDGKVGINNTDPDQKLSVNGVISSDENQDFYGAWLQGNSASNGYSSVAVGEWYSSGLYIQKKTGEAFSHMYSYAPAYPIAIAAGSGSYGETALTDGQGKVGIGTTGPTAKLHVVDNDSDDYIAIFKQTHTSNLGTVNIDTPTDNNSRPSRLDFSRGGNLKWKTGMVYGDTSNGWGLSDATGSGTALQQTRFLVQPGGNVGIGTTSPDLKLDVSHGTTTEYVATFQNTADNLELKIGTTTGALLNIQGQVISSSAAYNIGLQADGGNVGIGTASPAKRLHVVSASNQIRIEDSTNNRKYDLNVDGDKFMIDDMTAGANRFAIDSSGNVGIGTTNFITTGAKFQVKGTSASPGISGSNFAGSIFSVEGTSTVNISMGTTGASSYDGWIQVHDAGNGTNYDLLLNPLGGNVGIGTTSPGAKLEISGKDDAGASDLLRLQFDNSPADTGITFTDIFSTVKSRITLDSGNTNDLRISSGTKLHLYGGTTNGTTSPHLTVSNNGNVGIGTDSPGHVLDLAKTSGDVAIRLKSTTAGDPTIIFDSAASNRNGLIKYLDNGTHVGSIQYVHNGDRIDFQAGSATGATMSVRNGEVEVDNLKLKEIAESTSDTAVRVFVYDTRKDSDGGAWRKRTSHTSWYNETLNTSTRGSRREFPAVAIIIATSTSVIIRDGDHPDMPMWMIFNNGGWNSYALGSGQTFTGIAALNGSLAATQQPYGYKRVNFISEHAEFREKGYYRHLFGGLSERNGGMDESPEIDSNQQLPHDACYDVAMTVLPDAPTDITTGLPVPTIAIANYEGMSVIKDDNETVVDINTGAGSGYTVMVQADITSDGYVGWTHNDNRSHKVAAIPDGDASYGFWTYNQGVYNFYESHAFVSNLGNVPYLQESGGGNRDIIIGKAVSSTDGLTMVGLQKAKPAGVYGDPDMPMVAYITSDYNTGWMVTDTKLATLSDTSTTSDTGPELVTNGTTFSNTTGWSGNTATVSVSGGQLVVTGTATSAQNQSASFTAFSCNVGDQFIVSFDITERTAVPSSSGIIIGNAQISANNNLHYWYPNAVGSYTTKVTATSTSIILQMHAGTGVGVITKFDNISAHKLNVKDRSHNQNDVRVVGTMAKTAVTTGAELVGYGPFSTSNYMESPYSSDLDFDTGNFSTCFWTNNPATGSEYIWDRADDNGNYRIALYLSNNNSGSINFYTRDGSQYTEVTGIIGTPNEWAQVWCIRRGTTHEIWVNGIKRASATGTIRDVSSASGEADLHIGTRYNKVAPNTGKLSLLRIFGIAPSEEQIAKMWNDERKLFQTNGKATLAGTSNDVTAIAYDEDTELLHAGSSWGRSVFQGLNRIEYSSDVVTTAISASNGIVVEE